MKVLTDFSRLFVGLVFVFSGFVKGVDPLGTAYKLDDYFIAFNMEWAMCLSLTLAVLLSTLEFLIGVVLLFKLKIRFFSWVLFLLMIFFTLLTLNDAINNPVPDCGCFGDAIKLTNWQTFYKNIVLMVFVSLIFFRRKKIKVTLGKGSQLLIIIFSSLLFIGFEIYNYTHLPVIDFRPYKVGNKIHPELEEPVKVYVTYRNKETGEEKEYLSPDFPWNDSVWMSKWEFVDQHTVLPEGAPEYELRIESEHGDDYTDYYLENPGKQLLLISYDLDKASQKGFKRAYGLFDSLYVHGYTPAIITSTLPSKVAEFKQQFKNDYDYLFADDIILKTVVRANPGLVLLDNGVIVEKWHYNDIPDYREFLEQFPEMKEQ